MGWERYQLFRFSADYLTFFSTKPYPILLYLQAFFTQFYLYPLLGAAVISGLFALGVGAWHRLTGRFWTGLVWTAFMLPLLPYFNLLWVLVWLVLLGGGLLIHLRRLSTAGRLALTAGLALAGTFILQENVVFALLFWSLIGGLRTRSWQNGLYGLAAGLVGAGAGFGLSIWPGYPYFYTIHLKNWTIISLSGSDMLPFPALFFGCPQILRVWTYVGSIAGLCFPLTNLIFKKDPVDNRKKTRFKHIGLAATVSMLLLSAAYLNLRYQTEDFLLVDRLTAQGQYQKAIETAEQSFFQRANPENRGAYTPLKRSRIGKLGIHPAPFQNDLEEHSMVSTLKINLLADKQATSRIFTYNGSRYFPLLFPDDILHSSVPHYMAFFYTRHGFYAEALHILYDLVTSKYISTAVLEPLLWNSVVVGDYEPCRKFIHFFEQSLFHKDIARRYAAYLADTAQTARQPEIAAARLQLADRNHRVLAYQPDDNIYFRLLYGSDNATAYEYALALWMVYKNHNRILAELPKIRQYYQTLPTHIQEAVLACFPAENLDEVPEGIDPWIISRYSMFLQTYGLYKSGYTSFKKLRKGFEDTYWYHLYFNEFKPIDSHPSGKGGEI